MKKSRFTTEQIIAVLQEHDPGDLVRRHGISKATLYHGKKQYGDLQVSDADVPPEKAGRSKLE